VVEVGTLVQSPQSSWLQVVHGLVKLLGTCVVGQRAWVWVAPHQVRPCCRATLLRLETLLVGQLPHSSWLQVLYGLVQLLGTWDSVWVRLVLGNFERGLEGEEKTRHAPT
jgi:hypothetical protein